MRKLGKRITVLKNTALERDRDTPIFKFGINDVGGGMGALGVAMRTQSRCDLAEISSHIYFFNPRSALRNASTGLVFKISDEVAQPRRA